jgi:hypothetical protein
MGEVATPEVKDAVQRMAEGARLTKRLGLPHITAGKEIMPALHALLDRIERIEEQMNRVRS